jgi:hypothetical protein
MSVFVPQVPSAGLQKCPVAEVMVAPLKVASVTERPSEFSTRSVAPYASPVVATLRVAVVGVTDTMNERAATPGPLMPLLTSEAAK